MSEPRRARLTRDIPAGTEVYVNDFASFCHATIELTVGADAVEFLDQPAKQQPQETVSAA